MMDCVTVNINALTKDILFNVDNINSQSDFCAATPEETEILLNELEKNTLESTEILDNIIKNMNVINETTITFNNTILETRQ